MLAALVPSPWRAALRHVIDSQAFAALGAKVEAVGDVLPPRPLIFAALAATPPRGVKVVLLGQDPYPTPGHANGLAFSVSPGVKLPASLRNLLAGVSADVGCPKPVSGDLTPWAKQGVLLLNTALTVSAGQANSHKAFGWSVVTDAVLRHVAALPERVVFLCLGAQARELVRPLANGHPVLEYPHPSPLSRVRFVDKAREGRPFTRINELLTEAGRAPVDWALTPSS